MKKIGIEKPCSEDWNKMTPTEKGAFCQLCAKQVHDFSNRSMNEIKQTLLELQGQSPCIRMTVRQEHELNTEFNAWISQRKRNPQQMFITALILVFGMTLFSCEDEQDRHRIESVRQIALQAVNQSVNENRTAETDSVIPVLPTVETIEVESYIMGAYVVDFPEAPPTPEPQSPEPEHLVMGGGSAFTSLQSAYLEQTTVPVELDENGVPYPTEFKALAFPNPAIESTTLEIQAPEKERIDIRLFDTSGKFIREIHSGKIARGTYRQLVDLNDLPAGMYLIIIQSREFKETVRVVKN